MIHRLLLLLLLFHTPLVAAQESAYQQQENVVYAETDGVGLLLDVFVPQQAHNRRAIVEVASGAWHSDRGKIRDLQRAQVFDIFCSRGYTVFAVRPGSLTKFSAEDMVDHVREAIDWITEHADAHQIDARHMGLMGASAGGHLSCLVAVEQAARVKDGEEPPYAPIAAVGVFFPPTDFLAYGTASVDPRGDGFGRTLRRLAFPEGMDALTDQQVLDRMTAISPARRVTRKMPPMLIIHGDADPLVPLQQSQVMLDALQEHGVASELIVKPGGAHPWPTIHEEVAKMADWFDRQLIP